jgi:hypothetical protein
LAEFGISGMNSVQIELGFEYKMVKLGAAFEKFKFDITTDF